LTAWSPRRAPLNPRCVWWGPTTAGIC